MSDSVANLTVKVDTKSVSAAVQALDKLAAVAAKVEESLKGIGGKAPGLGRGAGGAEEGAKKSERALAAMEKRIDAAARQYEKMIRMINQANVSESQRRNLITDTGNAYLKHLAVIQKVNAGTLDLTRANIAWKNSVSDVKDSVKALETQENRRVAAAQKSAKELAAIEKKSVADSLALQTKLEQAQTTVFGVSTRARRQLSPDMAAGVTRQVEADYQRLATALRTYGVGSLEAGKATGEFNRAMKAASSEIARVGGLLPRLNDNARTISAAFGAANASMGGFSRAIFNTSAAISALTGAFALREITQSIMEFERFTNTLKTVSGSTGEFNKSLGFLFAEADRIGFAVGEVGNSFARLSLAMKGAGFSADESKNSFSMLAEASRNFGLSSADTMGVIRALEQSMSKGKFMAEEVRLQLGDRLPIAMAALDKAVTKVDGKQADLNKRFEEGSLDTKRYGLEFIRQINIMSGGADTLSRTQNSIAAAFGRLNNELVRATTAFGEGGFTNAIVIATQNIIAFLQTLREAGVISAAGAAMETLAKHTVLLTAAFTGLAAALSVGIIAKLVSFVAGLTPIGRIIAGLAAAATAAVTFMASLNPAQRALNDLTAAGNDFNRAFDKAKGASEEFRTGMTAMNSATRTAVTEIEKMIRVSRELGLTEAETTRRVGEETLKRIDLQEKEMERNIKTQKDAIGVRRNAVLAENEDIKRLMMLAASDTAAINALTQRKNQAFTSDAIKIELQKEIDAIKKAGERYADVTNVMRDYINTTIDTKTALDRLNAVRHIDPVLVDAARTAILKNADALREEEKALKANQDRQVELQRERKALANIVEKPQAFLDSFNLPGEAAPNPSMAYAEAIKKRLNDYAEAVKQFQGKYGDKNFTSQMKEVEKVVSLAGLKLEDFGVTAKMTSSDILVALAANTAFAQSFPEMTGAVAKFAAEIEKARNPLKEYMNTVNIEIAQNDRLIAASKQGASAFREAEISIRAEKEARALSRNENISFEKALEAVTPAVRKLAEQEKLLADFRSSDTSTPKATETLVKYLATLRAQIADQGKIAAAYRISEAAGEDAELQLKAETEAIRLGAKTEAERIALKKEILPLLQEEAARQKSVNAAKDLPRMQDEIALLEKERSLLGESLSFREQELAVFRALQQSRGASDEDRAKIENYTRQIVRGRQEIDQLDNSYKEMANIGVRAFEQVGDAITEAFAKGEIRALNFGNVIRGVMSSIVQSILRLGIVNPIINSIFSGTMLPTLGAGLSILGGGGAAAAGAAGAAAGGGGGLGSLLGLGSLTSLLPGGSVGGMFSGASNYLFGTAPSTTMIPGLLEPGIASGYGGMTTAGTPGLFGTAGSASLGGVLGAGGLGFGAGMLTNSLLGGNQTGGMVGSALGTGAGIAAALALDMALPGVGTVLALLGGAAGGGLGGLIGPKPSSKGFSYALRSQDGQLAMTDMYYNEQGRAQFEEANAKIPAINAYLKQRGLTVSGVRAVGGNKYGMGNLGYGEAASFDEALGSLKFAATANEELNKALSTRSFAGPEKLQEFVDGFIALQDTIKGLTADPVPEFKKQMDALIDSFAQATAKAREYGIGEEELLAARDKQIAKLEEQRSLTIRDTALEMHVRRLMAEGMDQEAQRIELAYKTQKEIESFTASLDALGISAEEKSRLLVELERTQAAERVKILKDANKNIRDYLDSLRTSSPLSGTTTMGRLGAAQELFNRDLAAAQTGNVDALNRITQSADTLLNLAREAYASTGGFHDIRGRVVSGLESLATTPMSQQSLPDLASVPLVAEMTNLRTNAAIAETAEYTKRFDSKLAELLPIAQAIQAAVEQANEVSSAVFDSTSQQATGGGNGGFALGGAFRHGRIMAYANGGIPDYVNSPTLAPMALFGEAGPEAIMPLRRGPDGRLGVEVNGSDNRAVVSELRAVRDEIVSLREATVDSDGNESTGLVEAIAELRVQVGGLREELRTARLRAQ